MAASNSEPPLPIFEDRCSLAPTRFYSVELGAAVLRSELEVAVARLGFRSETTKIDEHGWMTKVEIFHNLMSTTIRINVYRSHEGKGTLITELQHVDGDRQFFYMICRKLLALLKEVIKVDGTDLMAVPDEEWVSHPDCDLSREDLCYIMDIGVSVKEDDPELRAGWLLNTALYSLRKHNARGFAEMGLVKHIVADMASADAHVSRLATITAANLVMAGGVEEDDLRLVRSAIAAAVATHEEARYFKEQREDALRILRAA